MFVASPKQQAGSVLLMALVFLVLTAMIALTIMDTSVLETRMAVNQQFREEAVQHAEAVVGEVSDNYEDQMTPSVPYGTIFCDINSTEPDCDQKTLDISAALRDEIPQNVVLKYRAKRLLKDDSPEVTEAEASDGEVHYYFEMYADYRGSDQGLSNSYIAVGLKQVHYSGQSVNFSHGYGLYD